MASILVPKALLLALLALCTAGQGLKVTTNYYKELDCIPKESPNGNHSEYDCDVLKNLKKMKCFYLNKEYSLGESPQDVRDNCIVKCTCELGYNSDHAYWNCLSTECPENFGGHRDCTYVHKHGSCCADYPPICEKEKLNKLPTCQYGGQTYVKGQKFYPDEEPCKYCICDEGFNGTLTEPWCRDFTCNLYLHYFNQIREKCIPIYFSNDSCCPIPEWICPQKEDTVVTSKVAETNDSEKGLKCKFGDLELSVGQQLSQRKESKCAECICDKPPHLTCVINRECYDKRNR